MSLLPKIDTVEKFVEALGKSIKRLEDRIDEAQEKINNEIEQNGPESRRVGIWKNQIRRWQYQIFNLKLEQEFARPDNPVDLAERNDVYNSFHRNVEKVLSDNLHLKFHGTDICHASQIIKTGQISSSVDRIGSETSYDTEGQISVSEKNTLYVTTHGYTDLPRHFMPAGCVFVVLPKNHVEDMAGKSLLMDNVDFRSNPDQLYAIITTSQNKDMVAGWCVDSGVLAPVMTFDESLQKIEQDSQKMDKAVELLGGKINLSNFIDIVSALDLSPDLGRESIDSLINSVEADALSEISKKENDISL